MSKQNKTVLLQGSSLCVYSLCPWSLWEEPLDSSMLQILIARYYDSPCALSLIHILGPVYELESMILLSPQEKESLHPC